MFLYWNEWSWSDGKFREGGFVNFGICKNQTIVFRQEWSYDLWPNNKAYQK